MKRIQLIFLFLLFWVFHTNIGNTQTNRTAMLVPIEGTIGPVMVDFFEAALDHALQRQVDFVIIQINTPGGLLTSARSLVQLILNAPIPIIGYVSPQGARAASAGIFILYATHLAAMAPGTHLGAAIPIPLGGRMLRAQESTEELEEPQPIPQKDALSKKVLQDTMAFIRSLAELRQRNSEFTQQAVQEGLSLTAQEAYEQNVVEILALDVYTLLEQIHGRIIRIQQQDYTFNTQGITLLIHEPDLRTQLLMILTDPSISFIFLLIGLYALMFELYNPGIFIPGIVGVVCLLLSLYGLSIVPLNFTALLLILLGTGFIITEAFFFSFGLFALGGTIAFFLGSLLLLDSDNLSIQLEWSMIITTGVVLTLLFLVLTIYTIRTQRRRVVTGNEGICNTIGTVISWKGKSGYIAATGEQWHARANATFSVGQTVRVTGMEGLTVFIELLEDHDDLPSLTNSHPAGHPPHWYPVKKEDLEAPPKG